MELAQVFKERLREVRGAKGVSQQKTATAIGVSKNNYQCYEYGKKFPSFSTLPRIADFFNVSIDYLVGRSDDPHLPRMDEETKRLFLALRELKRDSTTGKIGA